MPCPTMSTLRIRSSYVESRNSVAPEPPYAYALHVRCAAKIVWSAQCRIAVDKYTEWSM